MDAFLLKIQTQKDNVKKLTKKEIYENEVDKLFTPIRDYLDPNIHEYIKLLKDRVQLTEEVFEWQETPMTIPPWCEEAYKHNQYILNNEPDEIPFVPQQIWELTKKDIEIADYLKNEVRGISLTCSPPQGNFTYSELLKKFKSIKDPRIKDGFYYIEKYTNGNPEKGRVHIHCYARLKNHTTANCNKISAYYKSCFRKKKANIKVIQNLDITYGKNYITAPESDKSKQLLKEKDKIWREQNSIPSIFNLN